MNGPKCWERPGYEGAAGDGWKKKGKLLLLAPGWVLALVFPGDD